MHEGSRGIKLLNIYHGSKKLPSKYGSRGIKGVINMQYKVVLKDIETNKTFKKYFKNEYFLRQFMNKAKRSKKIIILGIKDLYR